MVLALALISGFMIYAMRGRSLVPSRIQSIAEIVYEFIANMVRENLGKDGMTYFPWVFSIFIFILVLNLLGMIPGSFTVTSHIIVTFALAAMVWLAATLIGFAKHGFGYFKLFVPEGVPLLADAGDRPDRIDLVLHPPDQPLGASVRQHDGRPHDVEGVRGFRRHACRRGPRSRRSASWLLSRVSNSWSRSSRPSSSRFSPASTSTTR